VRQTWRAAAEGQPIGIRFWRRSKQS
jgi:hypothetical protein